MNGALRLDHIGIAVRDIETAKKFYLDHLGYREGEAERLDAHGVSVLFLHHDSGSVLELISPIGDQGTLAKFLEKRGEGLHHLCYEVPSVQEKLDILREAGVPLIDETPRLGAGGHQVAFLHPKATASGVLIEICSKG